jgi:hypothetical protein
MRPLTEPDAKDGVHVREARLLEAFVELAGSLVDDFETDRFLRLLSRRCRELLDVDEAIPVLVDPHGGLRGFDPVPSGLSDVDNPYVVCRHTGQSMVESDLAMADGRWPEFGKWAVTAGLQSMYLLPLRLRADVLGVLGLFRAEPGVLDSEDQRVAQALVDVATVVLVQERKIRRSQLLIDQLQTALHSRIAIEQAKGVLAERFGTDVDDAFAAMRRHARSRGQQLTDLARAIVSGDDGGSWMQDRTNLTR